MAMIACHECKALISSTAAACPQCGAKAKKKTSVVAMLVAGMFAIGVGGMIYSSAQTPAVQKPVKTAEQIKAEKEKEAQFQADALKVRALKASLKNPASFELVSVVRLNDGTLCLTYRATNSFNAIITEQKAITVASKFADYGKACAGKTGENLSYIKHAL